VSESEHADDGGTYSVEVIIEGGRHIESSSTTTSTSSSRRTTTTAAATTAPTPADPAVR
jgi:hypothetical protein